jgi:NAD(P)-dependent dehydrogenase (short-subunit alcohol dehydrogenase family)
MSSKPVALILGAGPNVGLAISSSLSTLNYRIATASRSGTNSIHPDTGILTLQADFTTPTNIPHLFSLVLKEFGTQPSVVVWNAAALTPPPAEDSVLSVSVEQFGKDLNVNTVSAYAAAQEAVKGWDSMAGQQHAAVGKKTFIYTGNMLNQTVAPVPLFLTLGVGKSASAHWVGLADALYRDKGYR